MKDEHKISVTMQYVVTTEHLKDVLCTAFEGGSNYWVMEVKIPEDWYNPKPNLYKNNQGDSVEHFHELPAIGFSLLVRGLGDSFWYTLDQEKLLQGVTRAAKEHRINLGDEEWTMDVDADVADVILQYALFDELRYG